MGSLRRTLLQAYKYNAPEDPFSDMVGLILIGQWRRTLSLSLSSCDHFHFQLSVASSSLPQFLLTSGLLVWIATLYCLHSSLHRLGPSAASIVVSIQNLLCFVHYRDHLYTRILWFFRCSLSCFLISLSSHSNVSLSWLLSILCIKISLNLRTN